jgi:hypothetical protein
MVLSPYPRQVWRLEIFSVSGELIGHLRARRVKCARSDRNSVIP